MTDSKQCTVCGATYYRPHRYNNKTWAKRKFCSPECSHIGRKKVRKETGATAEYRALDNTAKSMKAIDYNPGTWERAHIKNIEDRPKPRRYVKVNPREKQEPGVYYNPCRINL